MSEIIMNRALKGLALSAAIVFIVRLCIYNIIQFPAPVGDGILFASVSMYGCAEGVFSTPIFPLDPSGNYRFIWHAIGQPALISLLNLPCTNEGNYFALSILICITFGVAYLLFRRQWGTCIALFFAVAVCTLQVREGFRPETLAVLLSLLAEIFRCRSRLVPWTILASLMIWVHPTAFIIYTVFVACTIQGSELVSVKRNFWICMPLIMLLHAIILIIYPFEIKEMLSVFSTQAKLFSNRTDGDLFTYFLRSDFYPLFGILFLASYLKLCFFNYRCIFLFPLIWYYALRVPPAYYNVVPLFVSVLTFISFKGGGPAEFDASLNKNKSTKYIIIAAGVLAAVGLAQGNLRDFNSILRYGATLGESAQRFSQLSAWSPRICLVPGFITLMKPSNYFTPDFVPRAKTCLDEKLPGSRVDLYEGNKIGRDGIYLSCDSWPIGEAGVLSGIFKSDSGYSFAYCIFK